MKVVGRVKGNMGMRDSVVVNLTNELEGTLISQDDAIPECDVLLSWRFPPADIPSNVMTCHFDLGYFDDTRYGNFSISVDGVHGHSRLIKGVRQLPTRPHPPLRRVEPRKGPVIILSPGTEGNATRHPINQHPEGWADILLDEYQHRGIPARIRHHPKQLPPGVTQHTLEYDIERAGAFHTYSSTAAVQTLIAGVITYTDSPRGLTYGVTGKDAVARRRWIHRLSHQQYHILDEIKLAADYIRLAWREK